VKWQATDCVKEILHSLRLEVQLTISVNTQVMLSKVTGV